MSSIDLDRTCDATANSGYSNKWTFSAWVKRGIIGTEQGLFANKRTDNNTNSRFRLRIKSDNKLSWECKDSGGSDDSSFETNMLLRDTNAWYHIVFIYDSDNSTESDRMKCYVNGQDVRTELGGFSSINEVGSGFGTLWSSSVKNYIGVSHDNSGNPYRWDGLMSHVHFTYGYRYEASTFGSTDSTTGEWKIKTTPSVTYGSQGFWLFKDNAAVTDQSGEGNNYTLNSGTLTKTEDNPSNVFATLNPLVSTASTPSFTQGNNTVSPSAGAYQNHFSTIGMTGSGKYYWEMKVNGSPNSANYHGVSSDIELNNLITVSNIVGYTSTGYSLVASSGNKYNNTTSSSYGSALANGDIMMGALDLDNGKIWFGKNGTWFNSGNPASGTYEAFSSISASNTYFVSGTVYNGGFTSINFNFGNGYFGTTAISSEGTNASGIGKFEYDVPSGFTALSTKGLNE